MKNTIHQNITTLNRLNIINCHDSHWEREQLISKCRILLEHIDDTKNPDVFNKIAKEILESANALISKWDKKP